MTKRRFALQGIIPFHGVASGKLLEDFLEGVLKMTAADGLLRTGKPLDLQPSAMAAKAGLTKATAAQRH